jgi:phenylalanyl-tRNA synthetase beta chain
MNPDQAFVRVSLIPGLLKNIAFNRRRFSDIRLFECGKTYESTEETPKETRLFSGALLLSSAKKEEPFFVLKSEISQLFHSVGVSVSFRSRTSNESLWHPMRSAEIVGSDGAFLGIIGEIHPLVGKSFDISSRVACFEFDARILLNATRADMLFIPIRKYPETLRDLSCFIPERMPVADIERAIFAAGRGLVLGIELFDRYVDAERGRSVAFHVRLGKEGGDAFRRGSRRGSRGYRGRSRARSRCFGARCRIALIPKKKEKRRGYFCVGIIDNYRFL